MRKRIISALLIVAIFAALFALVACNDNGDDNGDDTVVTFVKTDGAKIIDENGKAIGLYGTNLGGWLVQESWLVPTDIGKTYGQIDMMLDLANRFGKDGMYRLLDVYEDNWVSELDFKRIKDLGLNCVRIPFTYMNLTNPIKKVGDKYERTPYAELAVDESKFARLDWAIEMCKKYSLYAILDMHGAVGSQNGNDHSGDIAYPDGGRLWGDDETGEICRAKTKEIWIAIANRYKNEPTVAVYDLMNEPGIKKNGNQTTTSRTHEYFDELYKAIREVDKNHIISVESCWTSFDLPNPAKYGWENVIYQYHHYNWASSGVANAAYYGQQITWNNLATKKYNVPILIGEFNVWPDSHKDKVNATGKESSQTEAQAWNGVVELYCGLGWNFTTWNFKHASKHSSWGLFNYDSDVEGMKEQANYMTMSEDEIAKIWARHNSENYVVNTSLTNCITPHLSSFNTNGNDNRSLKEIKADKNYYILRDEKDNENED
ncbi:MAG TPA: hypothetical protein DCS37_05320 [Clostridiales bacterium]|nr:hypothetical protein [Clostridiales bacterium]